MQLVNFSVTNFRSITIAHKVALSGTTILIGKNNEGKSNILKALDIAMLVLQEHAVEEGRRLVRRNVRNDDRSYFWQRDFPIGLQSRKTGTQSIFRLEFLLEDGEVTEFVDKIKSNLNGTLPIEIKIGKENRASIKVAKRGKGGTALTSKSGRIADFIAKKIVFNYIPAIRTEQEALAVIRRMLSQRLRALESQQPYQEALKVIKDLQSPILLNLAKAIKGPLVEFLPNIKNVKIEIPDNQRMSALRSEFEVIIDDGTPTNIEFKGDGVKSLAALSLLKIRAESGGASIIAIEEPESHLHPAAIHQLIEVVVSLAEQNQVIITTHNPLFVDRQNIKSNIIIDKGKATPARNVKEIRDLLGIKASDNLINASYVLVVEGEEDVIALSSLLPHLSEKISKALKSNLLIIDQIGGAGNLSYKLSQLSNSLCVYHALLDNDEAGKKASQKALDEGVLTLKNCTLIICNGMTNSEMEDCFDPIVYKQEILDQFGVNINSPKIRGNLKWSDRMRDVFLDQGKPWNDAVKKQVKYHVANCVKKNPTTSLNVHKRNAIDAVVSSLELLIKG
ncbi:AAA family ATPase [Candidatus Falkowbacteria bacterium]|nr:AAA family ATPase [Candidatus Falkowbacteria bacterium]